MAQEIERLVVKVTGDTKDYHRKLTAAEAATRGASTRMSALGRNLLAGVGLTALSAALVKATADTRKFTAAMAEVSTLLDDVPGQVDTLSASVRAMSKEFGKDRVQQAKALYQIISAGATTAATATSTLTAANKLAVGGVTDVATAADGLTSIMNAYGGSVGTATDVSDALFVAMRAGKTTIGELSGSIGRIAPLAAQAGVSLEEVLAATAALTKGGLDTSTAIRGLNQVIARIVKPTATAANLAEELGLQFNAATLESLGFHGMLEQIIDKTGGSTEKLGLLFEGVESLIPVLALAGGASEDFASILADMGQKAGETEKAYKKVADSADHRLSVATERLKDHMVGLGGATLDGAVPAMEGLADVMDGVALRFGQATEKVGGFLAAIEELRGQNEISQALNGMIRGAIERGALPEDLWLGDMAGTAGAWSGSIGVIGGSRAGGGGGLGPLSNPAVAAAVAAGLKTAGEAAGEAAGNVDGLTDSFRKLIDRYRHLVNSPPVEMVNSMGIGGLMMDPALAGSVTKQGADVVHTPGAGANNAAAALSTAGGYLGGEAGGILTSAGNIAAALGTGGLVGAVSVAGEAFKAVASVFDTGKSAVERFADTMDSLSVRFELFNVDDPAERFDQVLAAFLDEFDSDLFANKLADLNLTPENFDSFAAQLEELANLPAVYSISGPMRELIITLAGLSDQVDATTGSFRALNAPSGFNIAWFRDQAASSGGSGSGLPNLGDGPGRRRIDIGSVTVVGTGDPRETWENFKRALRYGSTSGDPLGRELALGVT